MQRQSPIPERLIERLPPEQWLRIKSAAMKRARVERAQLVRAVARGIVRASGRALRRVIRSIVGSMSRRAVLPRA